MVRKILIVDDEAEMRETLKGFFDKRGYKTTGVESGLLGLNILAKENFDIVISDIRMPFMDGIEFTKRAKKLKPDIVIIVLTGCIELDIAQEAIRIDVHDYLTKPVELEKLKKSIEDGIKDAEDKRKDSDFYQKLVHDLKKDKDMLDSMRDDFIALMSHELRTPVAIISEGLSILKDTVGAPGFEEMKNFSDEKKQSIFGAIDRGRRRLVNTIESIVYYTSLTKSEVMMDKKDVVLSDFLNENFEGLNHIISQYGVVLKREFNLDKEQVSIDRGKILDILSRLIHNAAFHNPKGTNITLKLSKDSREEKFAAITICDNGRGFEKQVLDNIFSPFAVGNIEHHGTGIGLSLCICKKVIDSHGGNIKIDSEEKKGTVVTVTLPLK